MRRGQEEIYRKGWGNKTDSSHPREMRVGGGAEWGDTTGSGRYAQHSASSGVSHHIAPPAIIAIIQSSLVAHVEPCHIDANHSYIHQETRCQNRQELAVVHDCDIFLCLWGKNWKRSIALPWVSSKSQFPCSSDVARGKQYRCCTKALDDVKISCCSSLASGLSYRGHCPPSPPPSNHTHTVIPLRQGRTGNFHQPFPLLIIWPVCGALRHLSGRRLKGILHLHPARHHTQIFMSLLGFFLNDNHKLSMLLLE